MTILDATAIARYCDMLQKWTDCRDFINEHGFVYPLKDKRGNVRCLMQYPQVNIYNALAASLARMEAQFGLTPSARSRIIISASLGNPGSSGGGLGGPQGGEKLPFDYEE